MGSDLARSLIVLGIFGIVLSYATFHFFGTVVRAEIEDPILRVEAVDHLDSRTKTHRLSGMIMLPSPCHRLKLSSKELEHGSYHIYFSTFGDEHGCKPDPTARSFTIYVTAPLVGTEFSASLDWHPVDFVIVSSSHT